MGSLDPMLSRMSALLDQHGRMMQVDTALPALTLVPERMVMRDALNQPFELVLDAVSLAPDLEISLLHGQEISLRLLQSDGRYQPWHGYVADTMYLGGDGGLARYRLVMVSWLHALSLRTDSYIFQDKTAQAILEEVFADHPTALFRFDITQPQRVRSLCTQYQETDLAFVQRLVAEEGWTWRFEHLDGETAQQAAAQGQARHVLVIQDRRAPAPELGDIRFTATHATARKAGQRDAIDAFMARRTLQSNAVTLGTWNYKALCGTTAQAASVAPLGDVPVLEVYDGSGAYRYEDEDHARRAAGLALAALELEGERFEGQGSARHLRPGAAFTLTDHHLQGPALVQDATGRNPASGRFSVLAVEHHATNNLGPDIARLLRLTDLESGTYRNHFHAVAATTPLVLRHQRRPTAPPHSTALVVGLRDEALTTERDHRVKLQFAWQRGLAPNPGGLPHDHAGDTQGNAPGNERSGTWVRVSLPSAGANWGAVFTPRIGTEVLVGYDEGDIDRPVVLGQAYNGQDTPPFAAGHDSGVNHPGVISGLHTRGLDAGQGGDDDFNQWVVDDAPGQLRMRLLTSYAQTELGLGHLIQQSGTDAQRGPWRGQGFEAGTQGWAGVRAGKGLLVSTSARNGTYGSALGTQMGAAEAVAQLKAARHLGRALGDAATQAAAHGQAIHEDGQALQQLTDVIDPAAQGRHLGRVNGQEARQALPGSRQLDAPVEAFAQPVMVLDSAASTSLATAGSVHSYSGADTAVVAQGDWHQAAGHTHAAIAGGTASLHAHQGGIKAYAANGPVTLRAHADRLDMLADQSVTVVSVNGEIRIQAQSRIEIVGGQSAMVLEGGDITFTCPGQWRAKGAVKALEGPGGQRAVLPHLPTDLVHVDPASAALRYCYHDGEPAAGASYVARMADGSTVSGRLDAMGFVQIDNLRCAALEVTLGPDPRPYEKFKLPALHDEAAQAWQESA